MFGFQIQRPEAIRHSTASIFSHYVGDIINHDQAIRIGAWREEFNRWLKISAIREVHRVEHSIAGERVNERRAAARRSSTRSSRAAGLIRAWRADRWLGIRAHSHE